MKAKKKIILQIGKNLCSLALVLIMMICIIPQMTVKADNVGTTEEKARGRLGGNEFSSRQNEYDQYNNQSTGHESNYCCSKKRNQSRMEIVPQS